MTDSNPWGPNYKVNIWDGNDELYTVRLLTLVAWKAGVKAELKGHQMTQTPVIPLVRKELSCPPDFSDQDLYDYLVTSLDSIHEQLGIA